MTHTNNHFLNGIRVYDEAEFPSNASGAVSGPDLCLRTIFEVEPGTNLFGRNDLPLFDFGREEAEGDHVLARIYPGIPKTEDGKLDGTRLREFEARKAQKDREYDSYPTWFLKVFQEVLPSTRDAQVEGLLAQVFSLQAKSEEVFEAMCARSTLVGRSYLSSDCAPLRPALAALPGLNHLIWPDGLPEGMQDEDVFDPKRRATTMLRVALASLQKDPHQTNPAFALQVEVPGAPGTWDYLGNVMEPYAGPMDGFGFRLEFEGTSAELRIYYVGRTFHVAWFHADEGSRFYSLPEIVGSARRGLEAREASPEAKLLAAIVTPEPIPTRKPTEVVDTASLFL